MKRFFLRCISVLLLSAMVLAQVPFASAEYGNGYEGGQGGDGLGIYAHGVDLSSWQKDTVDFDKIRQDGYSFVILRAGFSVYADKYFEKNYAAAKAAGLNVGVYLYSYATTPEESRREAEFLKTLLKGKQLEYPVYYDMEEPDTHGVMSAAELTALSMAFLDTMADDGWLVGLYSCKSWLDHRLELDIICEKYECWMAMYLSSGTCDTYDKYDEFCGMWQYSSTGSVSGVEGCVDLDVAFKDYPTICMQYGLNGYEGSGESIYLSSHADLPVVVAEGDPLEIGGTVRSTKGDLSDVTLSVFDATGAVVAERRIDPKAKSYDLSNLSRAVQSECLPIGTYRCTVTATNDDQTRTVLRHEFSMTEAGVLGVEVKLPESILVGTKLEIGGTLQASTPLASVQTNVRNADGQTVLSATATPESTEYALDTVETDQLPVGEYLLEIRATTQRGTETICAAAFAIWTENDPITLEGFRLGETYLPSELIGLLGTVTSETSDLRSFCVTVTRNGQTVAFAQCSGGKTLSLTTLNPTLRLQRLSYGTYVCTVTATNDAGLQTLAQRTFVIRPDGLSLCDFTMPCALPEGDSFLISGAVVSDDSAIEIVSVMVLDAELRVMTSAAATVGGTVFNLSELSQKLTFSDLTAGDYTLRITASNGVGTAVLRDALFTVTASDDRITWKEAPTSLQGVSFSAVVQPNLSGVIMSEESDIEAVGVELSTSEGVRMVFEEFSPMDSEFDLSECNRMLRFGALEEGTYRLVIRAQNAGGSCVVLDETFSVSACTHSSVRSGVVWSQRCDRIGAVADSRCDDCGECVGHGFVLECDAHTVENGICIHCGAKEKTICLVEPCDSLRNDGRYVLAYCDGGRWYALSQNGQTVAIDAPNADGSLTVSADLLWTAVYRGGILRLTDAYGVPLHLDSDCLSVGGGSTHTSLAFGQTADGMIFHRLEDSSVGISFDGCFTAAEPSGLTLFVLPTT